MRIGELLLAKGFIQQDDLDKALSIQSSVGGRLGGVLIRIGAISEDSLLPVLSEQLFMPLVSLSDLPDDADLYAFLSSNQPGVDWFLEHQVVLWQGDESINCVARDILDPTMNDTLHYFFPGLAVNCFLIKSHDLDRLLDALRNEHAVESLFSATDEGKQLRELAEEAPVIELVNNVMAQAIDLESSDIHVEPSENSFAVRLRVDGVLQTRLTQPAERFAAVASRIKLIAGLDIAERRLPQDGRITTRISGKEMDVRVSTAPGVFGESIVMRLLPKERESLSLDVLGMEPDHLELMRTWMGVSNGIVLVTGPTGSGKSTTLYGALEDVNDGKKKIITVEDPVEYQVNGITQLQAHAEIGYTFARALRAILRQDPDTIMIGEIRDLETAEIAIQSALTGHLVLSTLHTNDAISAFTRLVDMGVEPFLVAAPLRGVQAQRLVRKLCSVCSEPIDSSEAVPSDVLEFAKSLDIKPELRKAVGCPKCHQSGYKGRQGIYELVGMTPEMQDLIVNGASLNDMRALATSQGFRDLYHDGLIKALRGITTLEEVIRVAQGD